MNRAQRNHNPGNLRFAGQLEAIGKDEVGMAVFPDDPAGWRALIAQVRLDQERGLNIEQFVHKYAPPDENDTQAYIAFVCRGLRAASGSVPLAWFSPYCVAAVMAAYEGYFAREDAT